MLFLILSNGDQVFAFIPPRSSHHFNTKLEASRSPLLDNANINPLVVRKNIDHSKNPPHIVFPGGGIFFYWQAGAVTYLRENCYDLSQVSMCGASAGALTATLAASEVDYYEATELALGLASKAGVWERKGGLQGIWGAMIERWLDDLLPANAVDMVHGRVSQISMRKNYSLSLNRSLLITILSLATLDGIAQLAHYTGPFFWQEKGGKVSR
jgi:hypothetical protein